MAICRSRIGQRSALVIGVVFVVAVVLACIGSSAVFNMGSAAVDGTQDDAADGSPRHGDAAPTCGGAPLEPILSNDDGSAAHEQRYDSAMTDADTYRGNRDQALRDAAAATNLRDRSHLIDVAAMWDQLAAEADQLRTPQETAST